MISYWNFVGKIERIDSFTENCFIRVINPTLEEIDYLKNQFKIPEDLIIDILDPDERSRMEIENDQVYIIQRIPIQSQVNGIPYLTIPQGIILTNNALISICARENEIFYEVTNSARNRRLFLDSKINLMLSLFLYTTFTFHKYLKIINNQTSDFERDLERSTRNEELHRLLRMEKCLVYFTTSLKTNELLYLKLQNSKFLKENTYNEDLLDDVLIENRQAIEMANIYSDILSGMMDAFASIISNNLNIVIKQLTIVTIILMIPTLIASIFGMNVPNFMEKSPYALIGILLGSLVLSVIGAILFRNRKWL
ncbi:MAG TPA: magnesium transporter CorA family protein [Cyclobacteriaceae bacterium]|nr:magnesium transporter CorA family protein [Cyclobacteriaceae bacterium]